MYSSFNTLYHEKKRIQNDAQNDMRGILINQHTIHLDHRMNQSALIEQQRVVNEQRMAHFEQSRIDPPLEQRHIIHRRDDPRAEHLKHASQIEQERTQHMKHFIEKQRMERDIDQINGKVDVIKNIYSKYNPHEYDPTPREHYREQDLGPAVNQLIDLLNSFKLSSTTLATVANITSSNDLSLYAPLASPTFTGTPNTTTPSYSENSTRIPTTQWVNYVITDKLGNYVTSSALSAYNYVTNSALTAADYVSNSSLQTNYVSKSLLSSYDYVTNYTAQTTYATLANPTFTGTVSGITKTMVGLSNVDNTSDVNKPISSATQTALNLKSNLANPTFTGTVTLPTVMFTSLPANGTVSYTLAIDANNTIIKTTGSGGSINQSTTTTNANYSLPMSTSSSSGTFTPLIDANNLLTYNPSTGIFKTPICSIPKSTTTHPNLDQYELTVGDNANTTNKSAKIIIRGQSVSDSYGPSLDFTAWSSHSTPQARIEVLDDGNWGGTLSFFTKANAAGAAASLYKNMYLNTSTSGVSQMVFPSTPNIITSGVGYNWFIGGTQVGSFDYPSSHWRISTSSTQKLILCSNYQNTLQIGNSASGHYPVEIYNYKTTYGSYWQYTGGGSSWGVSTTNFNIGLYVQYTVSADGGYLLASDERIKTNIKDASTGALDVIKTIPIKSHGYIDSFLNGCPTAYNVIAQDIQKTYPEAITVTDSYIPDMFVKCNWISVSGNDIRINIPKPHTVIVGDKVRCILEDSSQKDITVTQVINTTTFVVEKWDDFDLEKSDEMFLYGKLVHDFLRVDKIKLGVLGLAGTKELQQIVETQQQTISTMASQIGSLTSIVNQLLKKYPL